MAMRLLFHRAAGATMSAAQRTAVGARMTQVLGGAASCEDDFGIELRVEHRGELVESRLSRVGEAPC